MKKILTLALVLLSFVSTANAFVAKDKNTNKSIYQTCQQAVPTNDPGFCASFHSVANCHCAESGVPVDCNNMASLYDYMLALFGNLEAACAFQQDTDQQTCIDDWNCYRNGGNNSQGQQCSANGNPCE